MQLCKPFPLQKTMRIADLGPTAYPFLERLRIPDRSRPHRNVGIVYPMEETSLQAAVGITLAQLGCPILLGPEQQIRDVARTLAIDVTALEIIDTGSDPSVAARVACKWVKEGRIDLLMKGSLHTDELMHAAFDRENGVRTKRRVSHTFVMEIAGREAPLLLSDCAINISPDLETKRSIVENAMLVARAIGIATPRVGILSATESILPAMSSTLDASALRTMAARGQIVGGSLDGPLALDNAVSMQSAKTKKIVSDVAGHADVLIMPNLEAGNILYKSLIYFGRAECAGIVVGTQVPIVLTSRADSLLSRIWSVGLGLKCLNACD